MRVNLQFILKERNARTAINAFEMPSAGDQGGVRQCGGCRSLYMFGQNVSMFAQRGPRR